MSSSDPGGPSTGRQEGAPRRSARIKRRLRAGDNSTAPQDGEELPSVQEQARDNYKLLGSRPVHQRPSAARTVGQQTTAASRAREIKQMRGIMKNWKRFRGDIPATVSIGGPPAHFTAKSYVSTRKPYVMRLEDGEEVEWLLPSLQDVAGLSEASFKGYLWDKGNAVHQNLIEILDKAANLLHVDAFLGMRATAQPHMRFLEPLIFQPNNAAGPSTSSGNNSCSERTSYPCMFFHQANIEGLRDFRMLPNGYVLAVLGMQHGYGQRIESMHRLIMYAFHGPPPGGDYSKAVVMHTCERAICANPLHLVWGTQSLNLEKSTTEYSKLLLEQHGVNTLP